MKIVVTGGSGRLGQHVVRDLLEHDHDVVSLDRVRPPNPPCVAWHADLTRIGDVYQALDGADAIVHLAAYQAPNEASDSETFTNNVSATYNVVKAAADLGIPRVVLASSIAAYGFIYAPVPFPPEYLPLDERHPCRPRDPYGLSKVVGEQIADSFAAFTPLAIASLRFPGVNFDLNYESWPTRWRDVAWRAIRGLWTYVDVRDAATACRLGLTANLGGHEVFNVAAPTSTMREPTNDLIRQYLAPGTPVPDDLTGNWSATDSTKAERLLAFKAEHTWQRYVAPKVVQQVPTLA